MDKGFRIRLFEIEKTQNYFDSRLSRSESIDLPASDAIPLELAYTDLAIYTAEPLCDVVS